MIETNATKLYKILYVCFRVSTCSESMSMEEEVGMDVNRMEAESFDYKRKLSDPTRTLICDSSE